MNIKSFCVLNIVFIVITIVIIGGLTLFLKIRESTKREKSTTSEQIIIPQRKLPPGKLFFETTDKNVWNFDENPVLQKLSVRYKGEYDFAILFPTKNTGVTRSAVKNFFAQGFKQEKKKSRFTDIKHVAIINLHTYYPNPSEEDVNNPPFSWIEGIIHEIGHYWCCSVNSIITPDDSHWARNVDLFGGSQRYVDIESDATWIRKDYGQYVCIDSNNSSAELVFSDFSLYFMGLVPPEKVTPIRVYHYEGEEKEKRGGDIFAQGDVNGPLCGSNPKFLDTTIYTVKDYIATYGKRIPSYLEERKSFKVIFIVVEAKDAVASDKFLELVDGYRKRLPNAWAKATRGLSSLKTSDMVLKFDEIIYTFK